MSTLCLSYEDFAALCEQVLGAADAGPQRNPRLLPPAPGTRRYRGRWARTLARGCSGRLALGRGARPCGGLRLAGGGLGFAGGG